MLSVEQIVKAVSANLAEFGTLFSQAQSGRGSQTAFRMIQLQAGAADPILEALNQANAAGFLQELLILIAESGLEDGTISADLTRQSRTRTPGSPLEAVIKKAQGFPQPDLAVAGYNNALRWTGKISIDGKAQGTGVLIAPHLVLTTWHVLAPLFERVNQKWQPLKTPGTSARITVAFDDVLRYLDGEQRIRPPKLVQVAAHEIWCVAWSECHSEELSDRLPTDLTQLEGYWDYVVLRVSPPPGWERRWVRITKDVVVPQADDHVTLFQYAAGLTMTYGHSTIVGKPKATVSALGERRFLHAVNTADGSSGGPCFDSNFRFFGIHQGVWQKGKKKKPGANRGIPLAKVLQDIDSRFSGLPPAEPSEIPIWKLGPEEWSAPVIGCTEFQRLIWKSAAGTQPRILIINGLPDSGRTFQVSLLARMLHDGNHLKVVLDGQKIGTSDPLTLAADICKTAGAPIPAFGVPTSTRSAWLKTDVADKTISALDAVRAGRVAWLALKDLNRFEVKDHDTSELLLMIYEHALTRQWLRIVLDGVNTADLPKILFPMCELFVVPPVTEPDILTYLERLVTSLWLYMPGVALPANAHTEFVRYQKAQAAKAEIALETLSENLQLLTNSFIEQAGA